MNEKLKKGKTHEEFEKKAIENLDECQKEIKLALKKYKESSGFIGLGGFDKIQKPIIEKYCKKHNELIKEFFETEED